ncbi:nitronate monooxygenase [Alphaproteobacteria bacterium]|nr:nitronate monooxygenase [Alphaproteobacteria bacterium]
MNSKICELLGIEFPLVAFSHCRNVVAEVSKAGGMGVLGAVGMSPEELDVELAWIDANCDGKPYGVDVLIPNKMVGKTEEGITAETLADMVPQEYRDFRADILEKQGIDAGDLRKPSKLGASMGTNMRDEGAQRLLEVAFSYPIKLIANALGVPPQWMLDMGKEHGVKVAALVGAKEHAIRQVQAGVDILVVSGTEGGGHCGSVSSMVLIPEVHQAIQPFGDTPILAAGGIVTGRQMAAAMAMGADGAWTASVWLTTSDAETSQTVKEKMLAASSSDTVRSRSRTGKHSRQLRSGWTDAWEGSELEPLPMPLQSMVSEPALALIDREAEKGQAGAKELATYWIGQGVGLLTQEKSARAVVQEFKEDFLVGHERLNSFLGE